jgi:hypothetical protein
MIVSRSFQRPITGYSGVRGLEEYIIIYSSLARRPCSSEVCQLVVNQWDEENYRGLSWETKAALSPNQERSHCLTSMWNRQQQSSRKELSSRRLSKQQ